MAYSVGVVIGRFQVDGLHEAHLRLLDHALKENDRLLILVGVPAIQGTFRNPLDYPTRESMLNERFSADPRVTILPLHDKESDQVWSTQVDSLISMVFPDTRDVSLYHARDGFSDHYHGRHKCVDIDDVYEPIECSGTQAREHLGARCLSSQQFRHGVIYASQHVWPFVRMAVDMIMYKPPVKVEGAHGCGFEDGYVVVGRKTEETMWRLPGGHVDPTDPSMEIAAVRELTEETGLGCEGGIEYVCSGPVEDWRYGGLANEALFSTCFCAPYCHGAPKAADDLAEVKWVTFKEAASSLRPEHRKMFIQFLVKFFPECSHNLERP